MHYSKRGKITVIALLVLLLVVDIPMYMSYLPISTTGHDLVFHLYRIQGIADALRQGQFPVRVQFSQLNGYGYPVSVLYGDLLLYPAGILCLIGLSVTTAYKVFVLLINAATILITFFVGRKMFSSISLGILAAYLWTLAPYRLEDLYLRASVGEYTALMFFPVLAYGLYGIFLRETGEFGFSWLWTTIGCSGIMISHTVSIILVFPVAFVFVIVGLVHNHSIIVWKRLAVSGVISIALTAWFIVPFLDFYKNVNMKVGALTAEEKMDFAALHAIQPSQLFMLFVPMKGASDPAADIAQDMPFGVGWTLLSGVLLFIIAIIMIDGNDQSKNWIKIGIISVMTTGCVLFASTSAFHWHFSRFAIWNEVISIVATIQFPWRLLGVASALLVLIACIGICLLKTANGYRVLAVPVMALMIALCTVEGGVAITTWLQNTEPVGDFSSSEFKPTGNYGVMSGEYLPVNADVNTLIANQSKYPDPVNVSLSSYEKKGATIDLEIADASSNGEITVPLLMYPHYTVRAENAVSQFSLSANRDGVMVIHVPDGYKGHVTVSFVEPVSWRIGETVSMLSLFAIIAGGVRRLFIKAKRQLR
ncbi:hypothetical protein BTIS_1353 [Bifidobacterium tissieri]|uniref:Membrane protein 6-pyruvoyl-tetrahydropterin synthase-related domain-containing protein n=1 Tax=Bifidobacterium tissieri TaxID=1630162 RepID=A0A261FEG2_9BIFI|nr:hypothetical protein [Bifidobacterium tissieri]OZG57512.1 hypothetical protein BTIS_1353 [Bifidobacterium tissieri]